MSKRKDGKPLTLELLRDYYKELSSVPLAERINKYNLREDRARCNCFYLQIYTNIMRWADAWKFNNAKIKAYRQQYATYGRSERIVQAPNVSSAYNIIIDIACIMYLYHCQYFLK